ncbi:MAG: hypothetical protein V4699_00525 [Patescibacteria group bacterium]
MKNKITSTIAMFAMVFALGLAGSVSVGAQTSPFPDGCGSGLGYSATTGRPCNGTNTATMGPMPGCTSALGYSGTTGRPCSGGDTAINYLAGCDWIYGYSAINGQPCNGTNVATTLPSTTPSGTPGLPTTGAGGNTFSNMFLLLSSALVALAGLRYLTRQTKSS